MPTTRTSGEDRTTQTRSGRQTSTQTGQSTSTQSGFSDLLVDAPGALEQALGAIVSRFLGDAFGDEGPIGPSPSDAAMVEGIRSRTFDQAAGDISRAYGFAADDTTTRLARAGLRNSSGLTDSLARLRSEEAAAIGQVGTAGAVTASQQLLALTESARDRALQKRSLSLQGAGTAISGMVGLGNLRASLGRRVYENVNAGTSSQSGSMTSSERAESLRTFFEETQTPFDIVGLMGALGQAAGGTDWAKMFAGGGAGGGAAGRPVSVGGGRYAQ